MSDNRTSREPDKYKVAVQPAPEVEYAPTALRTADDFQREGNWGWVIAFAVLAVSIRLVPRYLAFREEFQWLWNFTAVGALGLFAGARLGSWGAYLVPLGAMLAADLLLLPKLGALTFHPLMTPVIYASMTLNVAIGRLFRPTSSPLWAVPGALLTTAQFFFVTNLAEWAFSGLYPRTFAGLSDCFLNALPFIRGTLIGDVGYSILFFGLFAAVQALRQREKVSQPA
jgi:hypothetical protein